MFLTVATEVTPEIPVGNLEILQNRINLFFEYHVIELLYFS